MKEADGKERNQWAVGCNQSVWGHWSEILRKTWAEHETDPEMI